MQQPLEFEPERHTQFMLTFEETWPGAVIIALLAAMLAGVGAYVLRKRRRNGDQPKTR
jgi:LPXTG-motif cell wall-anchored protein